MRRPRRAIRVAAASAALAALGAGCATTVEEDDAVAPTVSVDAGLRPADESAIPLESEVIVDPDAPPTTEPVEGTAADLLPELGIEMSRLSGQVGSSEGRDTIARINGIWDAIRPEVEQTRPDLVNAIGVTVEQANVAVDANRPADADKAFSLLNDLIDSFVGDG
ncbi:MAG: hypothetical protein AAGG08_08020 [Actinomycetota bacterium]